MSERENSDRLPDRDLDRFAPPSIPAIDSTDFTFLRSHHRGIAGTEIRKMFEKKRFFPNILLS